MIKNKIIVSALILTMCAAALTSCGTNNTNGNGSENTNGGAATTDSANKETTEGSNNIVNDIESGAEDIGNDINDSITRPEDATHGTENDNTENNGTIIGDTNGDNVNDQANSARQRRDLPYGK